jgi:hypothetical protein
MAGRRHAEQTNDATLAYHFRQSGNSPSDTRSRCTKVATSETALRTVGDPREERRSIHHARPAKASSSGTARPDRNIIRA